MQARFLTFRLVAISLVLSWSAGGRLWGQPPPSDEKGYANEVLIAAAQKAAKMVVEIEPTGDVVLPLTYFQEAFNKPQTVPTLDIDGNPQFNPDGTPRVSKLPLTTTVKKLVVCTTVAEAMLDVAKPDGLTSQQYLQNWMVRERTVLGTKFGNEPMLQDDMKRAWQAFFDDWRAAVLKADATSSRFRDALRQAAYAIVRVGLDIEQDHINKVLQGTATPTGSRAAVVVSTAAYSIPSGTARSYHHAEVMHERLMNGIYRRHYRNMSKIERIQVRR